MPLIVPRPPVLLLLSLAVLAGGCDRQSPAGTQPDKAASARPPAPPPPAPAGAPAGEAGSLDESHKGAAMPAFTFRDGAGHTLRSADLAGKPALINLWATWCGPCVQEMPQLDALASQRPGLAVITVAQDMQADKVAAFFAERRFARLQPWLDPDLTLSDHYGAGVLPTTVLYDAAGREVWRMVGAHDWAGAGTAALLARADGRSGNTPATPLP